MYYTAVFGTVLLCLIFYSFEPYPYPYLYTYPVILTLNIYQSVVLKVVQLFPVSSWFPSNLGLKNVSDFANPEGMRHQLVFYLDFETIRLD